jgi:hypothetical protein
LEWFADVFDRFCTSSSPPTPDSSVTSVTGLFSRGFSRFSTVTSPIDVTDKNDGKPFDNNDVTDVTDKNGGEGENAHARPSYEVLGSAPAGGRCTLCGKGGPVRIKYGGHVNLWHTDCAARFLAAMANPPVTVAEPPPDPLDEHGAPLAAMSEDRRRELIDWYRKWTAEGEDPKDLEDALRMILREEVASPKEAEAAFQQIMEAIGGPKNENQ